MKNSHNEEISIVLPGKEDIEVMVTPTETTDGQPFYICKLGDQEAQLRREDKWEQIWGELSPEQVDQIGKAISNHFDL